MARSREQREKHAALCRRSRYPKVMVSTAPLRQLLEARVKVADGMFGLRPGASPGVKAMGKLKGISERAIYDIFTKDEIDAYRADLVSCRFGVPTALLYGAEWDEFIPRTYGELEAEAS